MKRPRIAIILTIIAALLGAVFFASRTTEGDATPSEPVSIAGSDAPDPDALYGRVTNVGGVTYEGRLQWRDGEEEFWTDLFNGFREENPWVPHVPVESRPRERSGIEIFGIELVNREKDVDLGRPFMARFGDITRIEADTTEVRVTLKSGTVAILNRMDASDFDDGVRVWDRERGLVDLDSRLIRTIELLPAPGSGTGARRLYGAVTTSRGDFTGFIQWNRDQGLDTDELEGTADGNDVSLRFSEIRSVARDSATSSSVTLRDGREITLGGSREAGDGNRGLYVDDARYGRVLISWDTFESVVFEPGGSGPVYDDFPPGEPIHGSVTTRAGRRFEGRLVYDLDESEVTETLDAPSGGVNYIIPFGLIASITLPGEEEPANLKLHAGDEVQLERAGDLGDRNAGILVFTGGTETSAYVPWAEVERIDLRAPANMYPSLSERP